MELLAPGHLILIAAVAIIVLGPEKLPEVMATIGRGIRTFNEAKDAIWTASGFADLQTEARSLTGAIAVPQLAAPTPATVAISTPAASSHGPHFVAPDGAPLAPPY